MHSASVHQCIRASPPKTMQMAFWHAHASFMSAILHPYSRNIRVNDRTGQDSRSQSLFNRASVCARCVPPTDFLCMPPRRCSKSRQPLKIQRIASALSSRLASPCNGHESEPCEDYHLPIGGATLSPLLSAYWTGLTLSSAAGCS